MLFRLAGQCKISEFVRIKGNRSFSNSRSKKIVVIIGCHPLCLHSNISSSTLSHIPNIRSKSTWSSAPTCHPTGAARGQCQFAASLAAGPKPRAAALLYGGEHGEDPLFDTAKPSATLPAKAVRILTPCAPP
jgi:hypothetical protein